MRTYDGLTNQAGRTPHPSGHPFSEIILYLPLYIHLSIHLRSQSPVLSLLYSATLCTFARATIWPPTCSFVSNASNIYLPSSNVLPMQLSFHFISQSNTLNVLPFIHYQSCSLSLALSLPFFLPPCSPSPPVSPSSSSSSSFLHHAADGRCVAVFLCGLSAAVIRD